MSPNVDLLRRTLAHIEAHPEGWEQGAFASRSECGTAFCFAGWAVKLARPEASPIFLGDDKVTCKVRIGSVEHEIDHLAAELLDLTYLESVELFSGGNDLDDLCWIVNKLASSSPEVAR